MKANEFVKKHGWEAVIDAVKSTTSEEIAFFESTDLEPILSKSGDTIGFDVKVYQIKYEEVKRLVESHELVEKWQGLEAAKIKVNLLRTFGLSDQADQLEQAIADVESCQ